MSRSRILSAHRLLGSLVSLFRGCKQLDSHRHSPFWRQVSTLVVIPLLLFPSYLAFRYLGVWVDFVTPLSVIRWGANIIGVGSLNGEVRAGIVGSGGKKFAVMGDTVSTGFRVEGLSKEFATSFLTSGEMR